MIHPPLFARFLALLPALLPVVALAACGSSSDDDPDFSVFTTSKAAAPSAPIALSGDWMVYLASEAFQGTGTNLNDNGEDVDTTDNVAFAVELNGNTETPLGVATIEAAIVGAEVYLFVNENADDHDWSGDSAKDDLVLLHWSSIAAAVTFVDLVVPPVVGVTIANLVVVGSRVFYASAGAPFVVADETTLRCIESAAPTTPVAVLGEAGGLFVRGTTLPAVRPVAAREGLLFCALDEDGDGLDHNNDGDTLDEAVLVLVDGTDPSTRLKSTELALLDVDVPLAARSLGAHDWLAAFLVDETAQGENLNDQVSPPLVPENCLTTPDVDTTDQVLFYLDFSDFLTGAATPVNTGLVGRERVLALDGFVATISNESDANCNLNAFTGDVDTSDEVARWVATTTTPPAPERDPEDLHALATGIGGGSQGLAVLNNRLVAVVDEAADDENHDGKSDNHELVAWLDPAASNPTWHFAHQSSSPGIGTGVFDSEGDSEPFAGTSWMAANAVDGRLGLVFLEEVPGTNPDIDSLNTNLDCNIVAKDNDKTDGLPVWADFSDTTLDFDGVGYAVDLTNAGIEIAFGHAFFRVSEVADARDYNGDGQMNDVVLFRNPLTTCKPVFMATSSLIASQALTTDRASGAAFLSSENQAGQDLNNDGDDDDLVVLYLRP